MLFDFFIDDLKEILELIDFCKNKVLYDPNLEGIAMPNTIRMTHWNQLEKIIDEHSKTMIK